MDQSGLKEFVEEKVEQKSKALVKTQPKTAALGQRSKVGRARRIFGRIVLAGSTLFFLLVLIAGAALDALSAGIITDGYHLPADVIKVLFRAKGPGRLVIVSDAASVAEPRSLVVRRVLWLCLQCIGIINVVWLRRCFIRLIFRLIARHSLRIVADHLSKCDFQLPPSTKG